MKPFLLLLLAASFLQAGEPADPKVAREQLCKVDHFCFGGAGFAGTTSEGERDFRNLFTGKQAKENFLTVFDKGNAQAKMYALVALRSLDRPAYEHLLASDKKNLEKTPVKTISGCIMMTLPGNSILANIEKGQYDGYLQPEKTSKHP